VFGYWKVRELPALSEANPLHWLKKESGSVLEVRLTGKKLDIATGQKI